MFTILYRGWTLSFIPPPEWVGDLGSPPSHGLGVGQLPSTADMNPTVTQFPPASFKLGIVAFAVADANLHLILDMCNLFLVHLRPIFTKWTMTIPISERSIARSGFQCWQ